MQIEKKYMSRSNWKRVLKKEYVSKNIIEDSKKGKASLIHIIDLTNPSIKLYNGRNVKIADKGYYWLQIAFENDNYWITAMYDKNKKIIQYYIDITIKNVLDEKQDAYFWDLFLDVVKLDSGEVFFLDENELIEALKQNIITDEEYNLAYNTADKIKNVLSTKVNHIEEICEKYFKLLLKEI